ncbi:probable LRR receptor-like serine/threonine-protein kinase At1g12460 [Amaranthus tricolor]|uniref:probable LRR receptor-like serine/threonine-protein kinase At1g12460 n=1 Tax=Amaranthus tricolor TaxID=29722 RepID=UPI0025893612|nr:probable LRR receptor-like serine/threonine-protein kinase At1g12460 [Amaranthus tricolor]
MRKSEKQNFEMVLLLLFFLLLELILVCPATEKEKEILLQFKSNVSNDPLNVLSSWVVSSDPCQNFTGITCDSNQNVARIVLWNTSLSGVLSPVLSGLPSLRSITLFGNRFTGNIPEEYGKIKTLWKLNLSSNAISGSIPDFLGQLENLRFLDLSKNDFSGEIPPKLFANCGKMKFISLSSNNLTGTIPDSVISCSSLIGFDASYNVLSGNISSQFCDLPNFAFLSLRRNMFAGSVEGKLSGCNSLEFLDLSSNMFNGEAPFDSFGMVNMTYFNISHNGFQGKIPEIIICSQRMSFFDASWNDLDGVIPSWIASCENLRTLDLENNKLIGNIPKGIGTLKSLSVIRLGNNSIDGAIPAEIGDIELLQVLNLHNLRLHGRIPSEIAHCRFLLQMDVSGNVLKGEIPQTLYNMTYLLKLDLHKNKLSGSIPSSIGNLLGIQCLDLSENSLSGPIPTSLGNLGKLIYFNVSYNSLSGEIPQLSNITKFGNTAFFHNPRLCGRPLGNCAGTKSKRAKALTVSAIVAIIAAALILIGVCIVTILNKRARKKRAVVEAMVLESTPLASTETNVIIGKLVLFSKRLPSKYEDWEAGTRALLDKERIVGGGSLGTVYRTSFEGGISIAVKKLETLGRIKTQEEFEQEIGRLGNIQHPHLAIFQGYYWSSTMQLILSEFIPNGNLYENLHSLNYASSSTQGGNSELDWGRRFQIALGTARALAYLHHDCKPPILHLNLKSTNILLDENYEPKLSDYGLLKLLPMFDNYGLTKFHNSVGYIAPELAQSAMGSDKCDVYSYGVVLLELVTGRKPVESPSSSEIVVLCDYVRELLERGSASDCFDQRLRSFAEKELIQVMKLGLYCTAPVPSRRPSTAEVVQFLESIRNHSI